jgi:hypothetical protein
VVGIVGGELASGRRRLGPIGFVATGLVEGCGQALRIGTGVLSTQVGTGANCGHKGHAGELDRGGGSTGASGERATAYKGEQQGEARRGAHRGSTRGLVGGLVAAEWPPESRKRRRWSEMQTEGLGDAGSSGST